MIESDVIVRASEIEALEKKDWGTARTRRKEKRITVRRAHAHKELPALATTTSLPEIHPFKSR